MGVECSRACSRRWVERFRTCSDENDAKLFKLPFWRALSALFEADCPGLATLSSHPIRHRNPALATRSTHPIRRDAGTRQRAPHPVLSRNEGRGLESWRSGSAHAGTANSDGCGSASKAGPRLVMLRYSKTVSKAARVVEIGVGRNPQSICDSCLVLITCGRDGRGPALDADPQLHRRGPVGLQDRVDHRQQRAKLGLRHRRRPRIARRQRKPAHLQHRLAA